MTSIIPFAFLDSTIERQSQPRISLDILFYSLLRYHSIINCFLKLINSIKIINCYYYNLYHTFRAIRKISLFNRISTLYFLLFNNYSVQSAIIFVFKNYLNLELTHHTLNAAYNLLKHKINKHN